MTAKSKTPEIRFKGFTDPWEQRKFEEVFTERREKTEKELEDVLLSCAISGMYLNSELFGHFRGTTTIGYLKVKKNDLILSAQNLHLGNVNVNLRFDHGIISPAYKVYDLNDCLPEFVQAWVKKESTKKFFLDATTEGASQCRKNIEWDTLGKQTISMPVKNEQKLIGRYFSRLDSLITLHQRKHEKLVQMKKAMLDKMFPKPGEKFPEIRFKGFTDPWEQRKLGELCTFSKGHGYSKADIRDVGIPLILYGRLYTQYESHIEDVDTFAVEQDGSLFSKGNEVIVPASGETAEDIAIASSVRRSGIILGGDLNVITPGSELDPDYTAIGITYGEAHKDLSKRAQGKSVVHVHGDDIADVEFTYPAIEEQRAISSLVLNLDSLITLHQRKLELLKNIKKAMLEKMFV